MLTLAQLTILKNTINNTPALLTMWNNKEVNRIAEYGNSTYSPTFYVWKTRMSSTEVKSCTVWTELLATTDACRSIYQFLIADGVINPSDSNIRNAFSAIFGTSTSLDQLSAAAKRPVRVIEKLYATGTGTLQDPGLLDFEGTISGADIFEAMNN